MACKFFVTRGYPLSELLEATYAERVLLEEAYKEWQSIWEKVAEDPAIPDNM